MTRRLASEIDAEAARYVARMDGEWGDGDERELEGWLARDPRHSGALLRAQAAWMTLDRPAPLHASHADSAPAPRFGRRGLLAAGGAALAASLAAIFLLLGGTSYTTSVGEIRHVPLADGSTATINTASTVEIELAENTRQVRLEQGEAWFQVAKDKHRPFVVEAGRVRVRAVGTAFSVRRRDGGAQVLVTDGVVEAWASGAEGHRIRLAAGSGAFVADDAAIEQIPATASAVDRALAWRSGKIDLAGDRLDAAVAEFNRYNDRKLVVADPALAGERFDGVFRTDDPEGFAQAVGMTLDAPLDLSRADRIRIGRPSPRPR